MAERPERSASSRGGCSHSGEGGVTGHPRVYGFWKDSQEAMGSKEGLYLVHAVCGTRGDKQFLEGLQPQSRVRRGGKVERT